MKLPRIAKNLAVFGLHFDYKNVWITAVPYFTIGLSDNLGSS